MLWERRCGSMRPKQLARPYYSPNTIYGNRSLHLLREMLHSASALVQDDTQYDALR